MDSKKLVKLANNPILTFFYFLILGIFSFLILASQIPLPALLQIFSILGLLILVIVRIILPKTQFTKFPIYLLISAPFILFSYLLIFATGGLASSFLVLTHFFALGLAFLLSPQIAISFIVATILLILVHLRVDDAAQGFILETPFAALLYFIAYIVILPFSYLLAKEYKLKEEWVKILEKQIATSRSQEEELLKNITDALIVLNLKFEIVYLNRAVTNLLGFGQEILGQEIFKVFSFKDSNGANLEPDSLPFEQTLSSKSGQILENIQIATKNKKFIRVDLKILPVIGAEETLGLMLVVKDLREEAKVKAKKENTAFAALEHFLSFLADQKEILFQLENIPLAKNQIQNLISKNSQLETLAQDFIYALRIEAGEIGTTWTLCDLGKVANDLLFWGRGQAAQMGVLLIGKTSQEEKAFQPKAVIVPTGQNQRFFRPIYVLGNINWIVDSLQRLLKLALLLCYKNGQVKISARQVKDLAQIEILTQQEVVTPDLASDLLEKFYGRLGHLKQLASTSGLEGYIAKSLIFMMGGNVEVEVFPMVKTLIFRASFGAKTEK